MKMPNPKTHARRLRERYSKQVDAYVWAKRFAVIAVAGFAIWFAISSHNKRIAILEKQNAVLMARTKPTLEELTPITIEPSEVDKNLRGPLTGTITIWVLKSGERIRANAAQRLENGMLVIHTENGNRILTDAEISGTEDGQRQ